MSETVELLTIAGRMTAAQGHRKTAGALLNVAAMVLLRGGVGTDELNGAMADALRDFDEADVTLRGVN